MERTHAFQSEESLDEYLKLREDYCALFEEYKALFYKTAQEKDAANELEHNLILAHDHVGELQEQLVEKDDEIQHLKTTYEDLNEQIRYLAQAASDEQEQKHYYQNLYERLMDKQREPSPMSVADRRSVTPPLVLEISGDCDDSTVSSMVTARSGYPFFNQPHVEPGTVNVYARVVRDDEAPSVALFDPIHCVATPLTPSEVAQFRTKEGLPVMSPSGQPYALSCVDGVPKATLNQAALRDVDHYTLAVTIINMIDNVLSKGTVVKVNTPDPFIAEIATLYIQHLKDNTDITITASHVTCSTAVTAEIKQDALTQFEQRDIVKALRRIKKAPWYEAAIDRSEVDNSLALSA